MVWSFFFERKSNYVFQFVRQLISYQCSFGSLLVAPWSRNHLLLQSSRCLCRQAWAGGCQSLAVSTNVKQMATLQVNIKSGRCMLYMYRTLCFVLFISVMHSLWSLGIRYTLFIDIARAALVIICSYWVLTHVDVTFSSTGLYGMLVLHR